MIKKAVPDATSWPDALVKKDVEQIEDDFCFKLFYSIMSQETSDLFKTYIRIV